MLNALLVIVECKLSPFWRKLVQDCLNISEVVTHPDFVLVDELMLIRGDDLHSKSEFDEG